MKLTNFLCLVLVNKLMANTVSLVIQLFQEIVQCFSKENKAQFFPFVTGTSRVFAESTYYFLNFETMITSFMLPFGLLSCLFHIGILILVVITEQKLLVMFRL